MSAPVDPDDHAVPDEVFLTPGGLRRLQARIAEARGAWLAVCADNEAAAGSGDSSVWHDNFAYEENQRQMDRLARQVRELEAVLARVVVVTPGDRAPDQVRLGARVCLQFADDDREAVLYIAGWGDGDPRQGRISYTSPLARVLLGARVGDSRVLELGGRSREVEVTAILPAPAEERA